MSADTRTWHRELLIDGTWVSATAGAVHEITDPATGLAIGSTALAGPADVDRAVRASRTQTWSALTPDERAAVLGTAAQLIAERAPVIAHRLTSEQGKPLADSLKETYFCATVFGYYAEQGRRIYGSMRPSVRADIRSLVEYFPVGTVGAMVPWNYPVDLYSWKVAPPLAAGCSVIAKPPPDASGAIGLVSQALLDAGLPSGALADLPGDATTGNAIVGHPDIAAVTATASTATGRAIMSNAAPTLKRLVLELGGQCPLIVLNDADIDEAATATVRRSFSNMGQICIAVNRVLVDQSIHNEFTEAVIEKTRGLKVGHGLDTGVQYGPVFNRTVVNKVADHVTDATARGADLRIGGHELVDAGPGTFYQPTVLDNVPSDALMMREETYGPALGILSANGDNELLRYANALPYGLAAYLYTQDLERGWALASRIMAGGVGINVNDVTELQAPFGGWKQSGFGTDLGPESIM